MQREAPGAHRHAIGRQKDAPTRFLISPQSYWTATHNLSEKEGEGRRKGKGDEGSRYLPAG